MNLKPLSLLSLALLAATSLSASANEAKIREAVKTVKETAVVKSIRDVPNTGLKEVIADSTVIYMDKEGQYLFFGTLLDLKNKQNLTELAQSTARIDTLKSIPDAEKIVLKAPNEQYRVTVFTDVSCSYCQLLHRNEKGYLDRGITIEYVAFPRGGQQSQAYGTMRQIWCAKDRNAAFNEAIEGRAITNTSTENCADPVARHYEIGDGMAIEGTPAVFTTDGKQLGGFLPPDQLEAKLKELRAAEAQKVAAK